VYIILKEVLSILNHIVNAGITYRVTQFVEAEEATDFREEYKLLTHDDSFREPSLGGVVAVPHGRHRSKRKVKRIYDTVLETERVWVDTVNRGIHETVQKRYHQNR
jgi:hypothetical protein